MKQVPFVASSLGTAFEMQFAILAGVRLLSAVLHPYVNVQTVLVELPLAALWACKWLDPGVP